MCGESRSGCDGDGVFVCLVGERGAMRREIGDGGGDVSRMMVSDAAPERVKESLRIGS